MQALEFGILNGIQESCRCAVLDAVLPFLSSLSDHGEIWIALALVLLLIPKTRRTGLVLALALGLEFAVCNGILKPLIARPRPCRESFKAARRPAWRRSAASPPPSMRAIRQPTAPGARRCRR